MARRFGGSTSPVCACLVGAWLVAMCVGAAGDPVVLEKMSQVYLPFKFSPSGDPIFCLGESAAEQLAYDSNSQVAYVSGNKLLRVLDIKDPTNPTTAITVDVPEEVTDVYWCGDYVAASIPADPNTLPGQVFIFNAYKRDAPEAGLPLLAKVKVGALPDAVAFTPDCATILVANEGEAGVNKKGKFKNPEGSVSIVDVAAVVEAAADGRNVQRAVKTVDFKFMNKDAESYTEKGVRWIWRGQGLDKKRKAKKETISRDVEPEQVVPSKDGKRVYINLQENNAVAVLDLETMKISSVKSFGLKDFSLPGNEVDLIEDGKFDLKNWPIKGLYQPDVVKIFDHEGKKYIATANEGDIKKYGEDQNITKWVEEQEGAAFEGRTTETLDTSTVAALADPAQLSAVSFSAVDGLSGKKKSGNDTYDELYLYGTRSFSIFSAEDMSLVYDSGNMFETLIGTYFNWTYNTDDPESWCTRAPAPTGESAFPNGEALMDPQLLEEDLAQAVIDAETFALSPNPEENGLKEPSKALTSKPSDTFDKESTGKGSQPESLEIGFLGDRRILITTVEKGDVLFVFDISDPTAPVWQSAIYPGAHGATYAELYNSMTLADLDPEGLDYISADKSPIGEPLLIVSGAQSGSVSIYKITTAQVADNCPTGEPVFEEDGKKATVISTITNC